MQGRLYACVDMGDDVDVGDAADKEEEGEDEVGDDGEGHLDEV